MINIEFDDEEMMETAFVVMAINPAVSDMSVQQLVENMKRTANSSFNARRKTEYVSTYGYVLTLYKADKDTFMVKPSVSAFTVKSYLERKAAE